MKNINKLLTEKNFYEIHTGETIRGTLLDDILDGGGGNDLIVGGVINWNWKSEDPDGELQYYHIFGGSELFDGDDQLYGYGGDDILVGGVGSDYLRGGEGDDYLIGEVLVIGSSNDRDAPLDGFYWVADGDLSGNDVLRGDRGDDYLFGGYGANYLKGGKGDDYIVSRGEFDILIGDDEKGWQGKDIFDLTYWSVVEKDTPWGLKGYSARVIDFDDGLDKIQIDNGEPIAHIWKMLTSFGIVWDWDWVASETDDGVYLPLETGDLWIHGVDIDDLQFETSADGVDVFIV